MNLSKVQGFYPQISSVFIIFVLIASMPLLVQAQQKSDPKPELQYQTDEKIKQLQELGLWPENNSDSDGQPKPVSSGVDYGSLDGNYTVFEQDQSWNLNPNPNPENNFKLFQQGQPAGDINGDGNDDYIVTGIARDETTNELEDQTWKTAVFFGGNTSGTPDQIIRRKLVPAGDLNGDGYADAVAAETNLNNSSTSDPYPYIFEGTSNGFSQTSYTVGGGFQSGQQQIAFHDFDQDGNDDVLTYYLESDFVTIVWGSSFFNEISIKSYNIGLETDPKRIVVEDLDGDVLKELVSFSGSFGGGDIHIAEIDTTAKTDPATGITEEQTFTFDSFTGDADEQDLHLMDINGNGYHEIYISLGRRAPKYVFEYDEASGGYNTTSINFFDGSLVPAGDLNNDGQHDFIQGDSTDNYMPWISYGPQDITSDLNRDYDLSGNGGSAWSWEMGYNPYSSFGDINGDGIDDALLGHNEASNGDRLLGRRILEGSEAESYNSEFHQYPLENYMSTIAGTQNIGDINEDGIDDFAMALSDQRKVEIYFGGETLAETADITLELDYAPLFIEKGDFNGDGVSDIGVMGRNSLVSYRTTIELFWGGSDMNTTADYSIDASDFQNADYNEIFGLFNIGDINNDGSDDFSTGSSFAHDSTGGVIEHINESYTFYGGANIAGTPDEIVSLDDGLGNYAWAGERAASVGDINRDGIDDFAVSAPLYMNSNETFGRVQVYYGGSDTYDAPDMTLTPEDNSISAFGWGLASGDFNGDGEPDIAVSGMDFRSSETESAKAIQIYYGGADFDNSTDQFLIRPKFNLELYEESATYNTLSVYGTLRTLPDFSRNGKDELLFTSSSAGGSHAAIYTFDSTDNRPEMVLKGPNEAAGLGGPYNAASGDFNDDGQLDLVLTQIYDNNDAYFSSRVYRYEMENPISIAGVEDVPEDQGEWIRVSVDGYLMDAMSEDIYGFDSWAVRRMEEDSSWTSVATVKPYSNGSKFVDVRVPKTQPTDDDSVNNTYHFKVIAYDNTSDNSTQILAETAVESGQAFDNIAPDQVEEVALTDGTNKTLSWSAPSDPDIGEYEIFEIDAEGNLSESEVATVPYITTSYDLPDGFEGVQNFTVRARDVNNNAGRESGQVSAIYPQTNGYSFNPGWNLIGLPVDANSDSIQAKLQDASDSGVFEYDGGYTEVSEMVAGKGYWVKFSDDQLQELVGLPETRLTLNLQEGWNLISGVGAELPVENIEDADEILLPETIYAFDDMYASSDTLRPGTGYWVRASADGFVTFVHPKIQSTSNEASSNKVEPLAKKGQKVEENFANITVSDGERERTLYFGSKLSDQIDDRNFSLPPLPPGDIFDARFADDTRLTSGAKVTIEVNKMEGTSLNFLLDTQNLVDHHEFVVREYTGSELLADYTVKGDENFDLKDSETSSVTLEPVGSRAVDNDIPEEFQLEQNYPNPFNPTTQIEYSITEQANVTIDVFNILGRKVATLIDSEQSPGNYQVTFDGSNLASGVYLYRLQAGEKISTKKFILAK